MNLSRLLLMAIILPSVFVVAVILVSFAPHQAGLLDHAQEHAFLAVIIVGGIIPFALFMFHVFRRIQGHVLRQNRELSRLVAEREALLKVGRAVEESLDLDRVLPAALEAVLEATSAEAAEVWLVNPEDGSVTMRHHQSRFSDAFLEITRFERGQGFPGIVVETGKPILVHNLPEDDRFLRQRVKDLGFRTFYALPLKRGREPLGVLAVASRDPEALTQEDELRLLELMADHLANAVENARLHQEVQTLAILTERERLAREMHDGLAQVLGYVNTKAQAVKELLRSGRVEEAVRNMEQLETAAQETSDDVREAILALGSDGRKRPLLDSLREYVARFSELSGLPVDFRVEGEPQRFNPAAEVQLLRIVQEALANVRKHARARSVRMTLAFQPERFRLVVEDDGRGFDPGHVVRGPWPHLGLQSMRERAASIGAHFQVDSAPGRGTRVTVEGPI